MLVHATNINLVCLFLLPVILIVITAEIYGTIGMQCIPQRAALLKSMLNFLKKAIQDPAFSDGIRHGESLTIDNGRPLVHPSQT